MTIRRLNAAGTETAVLDIGTGRPILFLHGVPDSRRVWLPVIEKLKQRHRCIAPDLHGFGDSHAPADFDLSLANRARWVEEVVDGIGIKGQLDVVCHDFGGPTALAWAVLNPDRVRRLVISATCFHREWRWHFIARVYRTPVLGDLVMYFQKSRWVGWPLFVKEMRKGSKGLSTEFLEETYAAANRGDVPQHILRLYRGTPPEIFAGWDTRLYELVRQRPTLCLWSDLDPYVPLDFAENLETHGALLRRFANVGHWLQIEAASTFATECDQFLS
jgi:haloalkane dehalogenase